jgi:general secretion pathway protein E/type IV pilus assembly protein PilB
MGIYELLVTNEEIRSLAHERVSTWEIKTAALRGGMRTLRVDAWDKAMMGQTSADEVLRVTKGDRIA